VRPLIRLFRARLHPQFAAESAGILRRVKTGKFHRFPLDTKPFTKAQGVMEQLTTFWQKRLDRLENYIDREMTSKIKKD
jgi:hypothetical protein